MLEKGFKGPELGEALRSRDVQLFRSAFVPAADGGVSERESAGQSVA